MTQIDTKSKTQIPDPVPESEFGDEAKVIGLKVLGRTRKLAPRIILEGMSVLLTLSILWLGALGVLMNRQSVDLKFFKPHYENWFSKAFAGQQADIKGYSAHWIQERRAIEIIATQIRITGQTGIQQDIGEIRGEFALAPKLFSRPILTKLYVDGGALTVARDTRGRLQIGLGTPETFELVGPLWLSKNQIDRSPSAQLDAINLISVKAADVYFKDELYDSTMSFGHVDGIYKNDGESVKIFSNGDFVKQDRRSPFHFELQTATKRQSMSLKADIKGIRPIDIAPVRGPYAKLVNLDAPVDLNVELKILPETGLSDLQMEMQVGKGRWKTKDTYKDFKMARLVAEFDAHKQLVNVTDFVIESEPVNGTFTGSIKNIGTIKEGFLKTPIQFELATDGVRINPGSKYDGPLSVRQSQISGIFDLAAQNLKLDELKLNFGSFQTALTVFLQWQDDSQLSAVNVDGKMLGVINPKQILSLWPDDSALGARNWVVKSLMAAEFSNVNIHMALTEKDLASQIFEDDHFNLTFDVKNVDIRYLRKMPWLKGNRGRGIMKGNQFEYIMSGGHVDGLTLEKGYLSIPVINPPGSEFTIDLFGTGTTAEMLRVSDFEPLGVASRFGITPTDFGGEGRIHLKIKRPLRDFVDPGNIKYDLSGDFTNASLPVGYGGNQLNSGNISMHVNRQGMEVSGPIKVGKWPAVLDWRKVFKTVPVPADYTLVGILTRDDLDNLGIGLRRHFGGVIDIVLSGQGDGFEVQTVDILADFTKADVNVGDLWSKPLGMPAKITGTLTSDAQGGGGLENFIAEAEGLSLQGSISLARNLRLKNANISKAYIEGLIDAQIQAQPTPEGVLVVDLSGEYLNLTSWVDQAFKTQSGLVSAPIILTGIVKKLALGDNYFLEDARAKYSHNGLNVAHAKLSGETKGGEFIAEIVKQESGDARSFKVSVPNAGHAARALFGLNSIKDGALEVSGQLPPAGEQGGGTGKMNLTNFTLVRAPAFAQLLSLASLQGMANTLTGEGMKFEKMNVEFSLENGVFKARDGRASGPALGLTAAGDIDLATKSIDFNGVLVPSYTVNSILGDIPLLGSVMVGKKGEGMFALNYTMKGPIQQIQVTVNPLSALTPGFLRRIFDVKREGITTPDVKDLIEKQKQ